MYHHSGMFLVLCAVCSLFQAFSEARVVPSEKCILKPGQIQRTFVIAFMKNQNVDLSKNLQLYLVTCDKAATVTVMVSQPFFNKTVQVDRESSSLVNLDYTYMIGETEVTSKVILVTSDVDISVFAFSSEKFTADAMACLPQEDLGKEYYITTPGGTGDSRQFAVANGLEHEVQVLITVSGFITYKKKSYKTGKSFILSLGNQQVIQFQSSVDMTGTKISSSAPVAVFSGHSCFTGINSACDYLIKQLHPVDNWGDVFAVFPFFTHTKDVITIVAGSPDSLVTIDSPKGTTQHSLQEGGYVRSTVDKILLINATKPVMVSYLFQESNSTYPKYDPFMTTVPPSLLGRRYYKFVTQSYYNNFIFIVSQASSDSEFYLDGKPLSSYPTTMKEFNGFRGWQVSLGKTEGQHEIYHEMSTFTLYVFGTERSVSYGYSMGQGPLYPEPIQEPEFSIRCLPHIAECILPYSLVSDAHLDALNIHLEDPQCRAQKEKDHYLIRIPYTKCGSKVLNQNGKIFYANTIYGTIPDIDVHLLDIPVKCEMESNKSLTLIIKPKVNDVVSKGYYNVSMRLYHSDSFTEPVTQYPHEVDVHSSLHVELQVESEDEELQILIEHLNASPSLEDTNRKYKVIHQGCQVESTLRVHPVADQRRQRFSLHAFKFNNSHDIYLSSNVIICHNSTSPNRCTQGCISSRQRRDVRISKEQVDSARLSQGPLVFVSEVKTAHGGSSTSVSVLSVVLCVTVISAVLGLVVQKEYYRRQQRVLLQSSSDCS